MNRHVSTAITMKPNANNKPVRLMVVKVGKANRILFSIIFHLSISVVAWFNSISIFHRNGSVRAACEGWSFGRGKEEEEEVERGGRTVEKSCGSRRHLCG